MKPQRQRTLVAACVAFSLIALTASSARAHGPSPGAVGLALDPDDADFRAMSTNVWGHLISHDGGETYAQVCPETTTISGDQAGPVALLLTRADGQRRLIVGGQGGLFISEDDGCSWAPPAGALTTLRVGGLTLDPTTPDRVLATTRQGGAENALIESLDGGQTWQATDLVGDYFMRSVQVHPQTGRVALTAYQRTEGAYHLLTRRPGEPGWTDTLMPPDWGTPEVVAIDPDNDQLIYLRAMAADGVSPTLVRFDDAAPDMLEPPLAQLPALSVITTLRRLSPGGPWLLGAEGAPSMRSDDGTTWAPLDGAPPLWCLEALDDALLACTSQLGGLAAVVISHDQGDTWATWAGFEQACEPLACAMDACGEERWAFQVEEFREWGLSQDVCGLWPPPVVEEDLSAGDDTSGTADVDGGVTDGAADGAGDTATPPDDAVADVDAPAPPEEGCSVAARAPAPRSSWRWALALIAGLLLLRRRRVGS